MSAKKVPYPSHPYTPETCSHHLLGNYLGLQIRRDSSWRSPDQLEKCYGHLRKSPPGFVKIFAGEHVKKTHATHCENPPAQARWNPPNKSRTNMLREPNKQAAATLKTLPIATEILPHWKSKQKGETEKSIKPNTFLTPTWKATTCRTE